MTFKTNLHSQFAVDLKKEESGVWTPFNDGIEICIRRLSSDASQKARTEAEKPYLVGARNGKLSDDVLEAIALKQLAYGVISGWKGVNEPVLDSDGKQAVDDNGKPVVTEIPFSPDTAYEILSDDSMKDFRGAIIQVALDRDAYKADADEVAVKN